MYYERTIVFNEYSGLISKVATTPSLKGIEMLPSIMMPASKPEDFTESLLHFCLHGQLLSSSQRELWYISRIMYVMFKSSGKHCSKIFYSQYLDIYIYFYIWFNNDWIIYFKFLTFSRIKARNYFSKINTTLEFL